MIRRLINSALLLTCVIAILFISSSSSSAQEVCDFFQTYQNNPNAPELKKLNAEHFLGNLCDPKYPATCKREDISLSQIYEIGISKNDEVFKELLEYDWLWRDIQG